MPVTKLIVVLANSIKHDPGRCIAGREAQKTESGRYQPGAWVRPVSNAGEGELISGVHTNIAGNGTIEVLDIFEVRLLSRVRDRTQPENWLIDPSTPWNRVARWRSNELGRLSEEPADLWLEPELTRSDRVTPGFLRTSPPEQSLYAIVPETANLYRNQWDKMRLSFEYNGTTYDLGVTDPAANARFARESGKRGSMDLMAPFVCVSLAPLFREFHYKVVAAIIW